MLKYEIRLNYEDGTFEVVTVVAPDIRTATATALFENPDAAEAFVVCTIDPKPQVALYDLPVFGWAWKADAADVERY